MVGDGFDNIVDVQFPSQRGAQWLKKINGGIEGGGGKSGSGKIDGAEAALTILAKIIFFRIPSERYNVRRTCTRFVLADSLYNCT